MKRFILFFLILALGIAPCALGEGAEKGALRFTFIDQTPFIGSSTGALFAHGDCTVIHLPDGKIAMVDTGTMFCFRSIAPVLKEMGIERIDYLVISHLHQDHTAGMRQLLKGFEVGEIIYAGYGLKNMQVDSTGLEAIKKTAVKKGIPVQTVRQGDTFMLGDIPCEVLWPRVDAPEVTIKQAEMTAKQQSRYLNVYALVFRMQYGDFSALMTGDIFVESEQELIAQYGDKLQSTMLKIPHHGNNTSTCPEFLQYVTPQFAVNMATRYYSEEVRKNLEDAGIDTYLTGLRGTIIVETDGQDVTIRWRDGEKTFPAQNVALAE